MDLNGLKAFLAVSAGGNMTTAARELGLTQSAISQSVRQLEEQFGAVLVDRTTRPLRLTAAGSIVRRYTERMLNEAEQMTAAIRSTGTIPELRIALVDSFAATAGAEFIRTVARFARICISAKASPPAMPRNFAPANWICWCPRSDGRTRRRSALSADDRTVSADCTRYRVDGRPQAVDVRQLNSALPIIRYSNRSAAGSRIDRYLLERDIKLRQRIEVETSEVMCGLVASGMGWGITTPLHLLQARSHLEGITVRPLADKLQRTLYLIVRTGEYEKVAHTVLQRMRDVLRDNVIPEIRKIIPKHVGGLLVCEEN